MFKPLAPPFQFAIMSFAHFSSMRSSFWELLFATTLHKIASFVAFLLPFKALMLAITPLRVQSIFGYSLTNHQLAMVIMAVAFIAFIGQWILRSRLNHLYDGFFGRTSVAADSQARKLAQIEPDANEIRLLRLSVDVGSATIMATLLTSVAIIVMPISGIMFAVVIGAFFINLSFGIGKNDDSDFDVSWTGQIYSFFAMAGVLAFFAAVIMLGGSIGLLSGLYVFIATRRLTGSLNEIARFIKTYRDPTVPRFLRKNAEIAVPKDFRIAPSTPGFLMSNRQRAWLEEAFSEVMQTSVSIDKVEWRPFVSRVQYSFFVETGSAYQGEQRFLISIFARNAFSAFNKELVVQQVCGANPLALPLIGTHRKEGHSFLICSASSIEDIDKRYFTEKLTDVFYQMWSSAPPVFFLEKGHPGDFIININAKTLDMLRTIAITPKEKADIEYLVDNLDEIHRAIESAPLGLHNPDINAATIMCSRDNDNHKISTWSQTDIEPIGCMLWLYPAQQPDAAQLIAARLRATREDCHSITPDTIITVAAAYALAWNLQYVSLANALRDAMRLASLLKGCKASNKNQAAE